MASIKGTDILATMSESLAKEYGITNLSEREKTLLFLGMKMGSVATEYIKDKKIIIDGTVSSYNYIKFCKNIYKKNACMDGKYYWNKLQALAKEGE